MDFFVWQERSRERRREFWQHAASLCRGARLQAHTHPARVEQHCRSPAQPGGKKDAVSWDVMGWDWYYIAAGQRASCIAIARPMSARRVGMESGTWRWVRPAAARDVTLG